MAGASGIARRIIATETPVMIQVRPPHPLESVLPFACFGEEKRNMFVF
jgi:hypothetical protein